MALELVRISHRMLLAIICLSFSSTLIVAKSVQEYHAVVGGKAFLPCNVTAPNPKDVAILILWYYEDTSAPIYAVDARRDPLDKARHVSGKKLMSRGYFNTSATIPGLSIYPVRLEDNGTYRCRVDYRRHPTFNFRFKLHVTGNSSLPKTTTSITIQAGTTAYLKCEINPEEDETVVWIRQRDSTTLTVGSYTFINDDRFQPIHSENSDHWYLRIKYTRPSDEGLYECRVTGNRSRSSHLRLKLVKSVAKILQGPEIYVEAGSSINLTCLIAYTEQAPKFVFWYFDEKMINEFANQVVITTEGRGNNTIISNLQVKNSRRQDSGNYVCKPSSSETDSTLVKVKLPPTTIVEGPEIVLEAGNSIDLTCVYSREVPSSLKWYLQDDLIPSGSVRTTITRDEDNGPTTFISRLHIEDAQPADSGNYTCHRLVSDSFSTLVSVTEEKDDSSQLITNLVTNVSVQIGQNAYLHCNVNRTGDQVVAWIRQQNCDVLTIGIYSFTSDNRIQAIHIQDSNDWVLQIRNARDADEGLYECLVSGKEQKTYFQLNVLVPQAKILEGPDMYVEVGSTISLTCIIVDSPEVPAFVFWYQDDRLINYDSSRGAIIEQKGGVNSAISRLQIKDAKPLDSGNYICCPSNAESVSTIVHVVKGESQTVAQNENLFPLNASLVSLSDTNSSHLDMASDSNENPA